MTTTVCIGDQFRIGTAVFEVTQPRVTCYRVGVRMADPRVPALLVAHHRPGFYLRVLTEGTVAAGDEIIQVGFGPERMTVAEIDALLYLPGHPRRQLVRALNISALSPDGRDRSKPCWPRSIRPARAGTRAWSAPRRRLPGPASGSSPSRAGNGRATPCSRCS